MFSLVNHAISTMNYHNYGTYKAYVKAPSHLSEVLRTFLHNYCGVINEGAYTVTDRELSEVIKQYLGYKVTNLPLTDFTELIS